MCNGPEMLPATRSLTQRRIIFPLCERLCEQSTKCPPRGWSCEAKNNLTQKKTSKTERKTRNTMMKLTPLLFVILASFGPSWTQGYQQHTPPDCPPSISPGPTESPAPSPSPSETPTEATPSLSLAPSVAPTNAPSTSAPSVPPTNSPTESPAPSPSPSETPTSSPSSSPSVSKHPTVSSPPTTEPSVPPTKAPSPSPSEFPTKQPSSPPSQSSSPTSSPSSSPSAAPTTTPSISPAPSTTMSPSMGPVYVVATGNTAIFNGVLGEMSEKNVVFFEQTTLEFLILRIKTVPDISSISFESVTVTNQSLETGRRLSSKITIEFTVEALILFGNGSTFDLSALLLEFFADVANVLDLRNILDASATFFDEDSQGAPIPRASEDQGGPPTDALTEESVSVPMVGAIVGIAFSVAGAVAVMFLWSRNRKENSVPSLKQASFSTGILSISGDVEDQYEDYSYSEESYGGAPDPPAAPRVFIKQFSHDSDENNPCPTELSIYPVGSVETSLVLSVSSFYKPALMTMESNIEIPDTPRTDYEPSNYSPNALDMNSSYEDKTSNSGGEEKKKLKLTSFFSPGLKSTKRKEKDSKPREQIASSSAGYMSKGSVRSPVRKDIRKHDIMGDVDAAKILARSPTRNDIRKRTLGSCSKEDSSLPRVEKNPSQEGSIDLSLSSIGLMDEVEYLYSTKRDPSVTGRPLNHSKAKKSVNGTSGGNFGFAASLQKKKYPTDYISDEESSVEQ